MAEQNKRTSLALSRENTLALKGVAILFVLLGHMGILDGAGCWGVHIFCFLSGYGLICSFEKCGLENYWKKKVSNVYVPYLFCTVIFLIIRHFFVSQLKWHVVCASLLGLDFGINADQTMWYISYIFCCYFVFWLFIKLSMRNVIVSVLCVGMLWMGMAVAGLMGVIWHQGTVVWSYVFTFPFGVLVGFLRNKQIPRRYVKGACLLTGMASLLTVILKYGKANGGVALFLYSFAAFMLVLSMTWMAGDSMQKLFGGPLKTVGIYSFYMYLNEGLLLEIRNIYFNENNRILTNILVLLFSFLLAVVLNKLESRAEDWTRKRIGAMAA